MAGFGYILAGAAQGLGKGIASKGEADAAAAEKARDREFQAALENLRSQNNRAETANQYDLADRNDARGTARDTTSRITIAKTEGEIRGALDEASDNRQFGQRKELARLETDLRIKEINAQSAAAINQATAQAGLDKQDIADTVIDGKTGNYVLLTKGGQRIDTGTKATDREIVGTQSSGGGGSLLEQTRGAGPAASAPARPAATSGGQKPAKTLTYDPITGTFK